MEPIFDEAECDCEHSPAVHDDGFGCTRRGCDCGASWSWDRVEA